MNFDHYYQRLLSLSERLLNSHDIMQDQPEALQTASDLQTLIADAPVNGLEFTAADVPTVRRMRQQLRQLFREDDEDALREALNLAAGHIQTQIKLVTPGGQGLLIVPVETQASRQLYAACVIGLAWAFEHHGAQRFRTCQAPPCEDVFVDVSKNGQRRFCGPRCANRAHSRAFRERGEIA